MIMFCYFPNSGYIFFYIPFSGNFQLVSLLTSADHHHPHHESSRLDYCHAVYSGISKGNAHRLQGIQNAAAQI